MDKGIITLAKISGEYNPDNFKSTVKHEKVRWITEADLNSVENELADTVPDFKRTLQQSFEKIRELHKSNYL